MVDNSQTNLKLLMNLNKKIEWEIIKKIRSVIYINQKKKLIYIKLYNQTLLTIPHDYNSFT